MKVVSNFSDQVDCTKTYCEFKSSPYFKGDCQNSNCPFTKEKRARWKEESEPSAQISAGPSSVERHKTPTA